MNGPQLAVLGRIGIVFTEDGVPAQRQLGPQREWVSLDTTGSSGFFSRSLLTYL
jgi:hypothetical protein